MSRRGGAGAEHSNAQTSWAGARGRINARMRAPSASAGSVERPSAYEPVVIACSTKVKGERERGKRKATPFEERVLRTTSTCYVLPGDKCLTSALRLALTKVARCCHAEP
eukprot:scaffold23142_cov33-Tisochrysis_lutea.AAC.6